MISGHFAIAAGELRDRAVATPPAGSFVHLPAGMPHYALAYDETVVQINASGPFDIQYVDSNADPRLHWRPVKRHSRVTFFSSDHGSPE